MSARSPCAFKSTHSCIVSTSKIPAIEISSHTKDDDLVGTHATYNDIQNAIPRAMYIIADIRETWEKTMMPMNTSSHLAGHRGVPGDRKRLEKEASACTC